MKCDRSRWKFVLIIVACFTLLITSTAVNAAGLELISDGIYKQQGIGNDIGDNYQYPSTPEDVVADFINSDHSVLAKKKYYLNCKGIDCEGEIPTESRFDRLEFDFDLDLCKTTGLSEINTRIMTGYKIKTVSALNDSAIVKAEYALKGILVIACVPRPNVEFIAHKKWTGIGVYKMVKLGSRWKIRSIKLDAQPPLPKSEEWAVKKIYGIIDSVKGNLDFERGANDCIEAIKIGSNCMVERWGGASK